MKDKKFIKTVFICFFFYINASAQIELDPVTVTSSLTQKKISETGRNIISLDGNLFHHLPVSSIDEMLRYIPGVEVQMRGPAGSQSDIVLRGGTFQQVLVLLDGIRLNDPNTGHFNSYIPIAPSEIKSIEILKGASSAIYGSEAVGAVINIITRSFAAKKNDPQKQMRIQTSIGEYKLLNARAGVHFQNDNLAIGAGFLTNNSSGQPQRGTRGFFHNRTGSLSFRQYIGKKWSVAARSSFDLRDFSAQNFYTTFVSDTAKEKVTTHWNQLQVNFRSGKHQLKFDFGYKAAKDNYQYNPSSIANKNRSYLFQANVSDVYQIADRSHLVSGFQYQSKWIRSNDRGDHHLNTAAAFLILNHAINKFFLSPSLRIDYSDKRGTELVPQVNVSYHSDKLQLRASAGKTIRDADFTEGYNNYNKVFVSGGSIGNPDLQAERSFSYEAGADYFASKHLKLSTTFFQRRQRNVIDWVPTAYANMPRKTNLSPTGTYALAKNISRVNTTGAELDVQYAHNFKNANSLLATLGFVWLNSDSDKGEPSFYISSHAKLLSNFSLQFVGKYFAIRATGVYKNRNPQQAVAIQAHIDKNCFMMNTKADVFLMRKQLSLFVQVDNLFNKRCADLLGTRVPGRWASGGLCLSLGDQ